MPDPLEITIQANTTAALETELAIAEQRLKKIALQRGEHGILIVRHAPGHYSATLSEQVPFGLTREVLA